MVRLVLFALVSVVYEESVSLQALLGLALFFASVVAHVVFQPFASPVLHTIEGAALVANWATLYCGTLLFSDEVSSGGVKSMVTMFVVLIQVAYVGWSAVELWRVGKNEEGGLSKGASTHGNGGERSGDVEMATIPGTSDAHEGIVGKHDDLVGSVTRVDRHELAISHTHTERAMRRLTLSAKKATKATVAMETTSAMPGTTTSAVARRHYNPMKGDEGCE